MQTTALEACAQIRERLSEIKGLGHPNQYGLFLTDEDPKKGVWLEPGRTLEHYLLRDNVRHQCYLYFIYSFVYVFYSEVLSYVSSPLLAFDPDYYGPSSGGFVFIIGFGGLLSDGLFVCC